MSARERTTRIREKGTALVSALLFGTLVLSVTAVSLRLSLDQETAADSMVDRIEAREVAKSALAQALGRIKESGVAAPYSGSSGSAAWVPFHRGDFFYETSYDGTNDTSVIRAWGRIPVENTVSGSAVAPDDVNWNGSGYHVAGYEVSVIGLRYIPESPMYLGNGGVERPLGGFNWGSGVDPTDPSTWSSNTVTSPASKQASWVPMVVDSRNHRSDYLYGGGAASIDPAIASAHPYSIWVSQTEIGQFNTDAWLKNSAGYGNDPTSKIIPNPSTTTFDLLGSTTDNPNTYDPNLVDVQTFTDELWTKFGATTDTSFALAPVESTYKTSILGGVIGSATDVARIDPGTGELVIDSGDSVETVLASVDKGTINRLGTGTYSGTYGDILSPSITIVTGGLTVASGTSFKGSGILVIRDDFDPVVDTNNTPSTYSSLRIDGDFEWTGLVIIAGWRPGVTVNSSGSAVIVGSFFGEDSVQSGGETSLDSATISLNVNGPFELRYSHDLMRPGGMIWRMLPPVQRRVVGIRRL